VSLVLLAAMGGVAIEYSRSRPNDAKLRRRSGSGEWKQALPSEVASLIRERNPSDPIVSKRLVAMFDSDEPTRNSTQR